MRVHVCVSVCRSETSDRSKGVFVSKLSRCQQEQSNQISVRATCDSDRKKNRPQANVSAGFIKTIMNVQKVVEYPVLNRERVDIDVDMGT